MEPARSDENGVRASLVTPAKGNDTRARAVRTRLSDLLERLAPLAANGPEIPYAVLPVEVILELHEDVASKVEEHPLPVGHGAELRASAAGPHSSA